MKAPKSALEEEFAIALKDAGIYFVRAWTFHPDRKWRFDFAFAWGVAAEVEGGTWVGGRHVQGGGFQKDCEKYNAATMNGWRVFRFTGEMVKDGTALETIKEALGQEEPCTSPQEPEEPTSDSTD